MGKIFKPDFLIIGSMKSGTTTLYDDLSKLGTLWLPSDKEPSILRDHANIADIKSAYQRYFNHDANIKCGEASTFYTMLPYSEDVVGRAKQLCGNDLKLIMIMRDPLERIYSHLRHDISCGTINISQVEKVVLDDIKYVSYSDYAMQIRPWVDTFGVENLMCISFFDYCQNREKVIKSVTEFIGVDFVDGAIDIGNISNKSTELRKTPSFVGYCIRSDFYRHYLRPYLPLDLIRFFRRMLLRKNIAPTFTLPESVESELRCKLSHVELGLEKIMGHKIKIFSSEYQ